MSTGNSLVYLYRKLVMKQVIYAVRCCRRNAFETILTTDQCQTQTAYYTKWPTVHSRLEMTLFSTSNLEFILFTPTSYFTVPETSNILLREVLFYGNWHCLYFGTAR